MLDYDLNFAAATAAFDRDALAHICELPETSFGREFGMDVRFVDTPGPENFYFFKDNGASVLAVAHLDTVVYPDQRTATFAETNDGLVVHSGALDDRLGAYIILDLLPKLGITYDILLTVGEESGASTAEFFKTDKAYDRIIEFDRGGTDVVLYQYEDEDLRDAIEDTGARVGSGIFSDISYMEHLGVKGVNWGVGYRDYHSTRGHAYLDDTLGMVAFYMIFHAEQDGVSWPHIALVDDRWGRQSWSSQHVHEDEGGFDHEGNWWNHPATHDQEYLGETIYFEDEYVQDPTAEELQAIIEKMDDEDHERRRLAS